MVRWLENPTPMAWVSADVQFDPRPAQFIKGSSIAAAMAQVTTVAVIQSLAQEPLHAMGTAKKKMQIDRQMMIDR